MKIAILIFDRLTALDAIGPYEVMRSVPGWEIDFVAKARGELRTDSGFLGLVADRTLEEVSAPDIVVVPGGPGTRIAGAAGEPGLKDDTEVLEWLRAVDATSKWTTSVCTGSLVLGAAGLLEGKRATSNWLYLERLGEFGAEAVGGRFVEDGKTITAAGVTAGLDMALHLVSRESGPEMAQAIQLGLEYDPHPPFDTGSPDKAPPEVIAAVTAFERAGEA
ncbi:MAG TPA: DJ-1/PfpI family protein [Solirubrobacterales bacterium]|nr:DJ-1/PfpI family protein [Solirubrobacterales bacterium]